MARTTQAQKDAYISKLEMQLQNQEDCLKIMDLKPAKRTVKVTQNKLQKWLIFALFVTLCLSLINVVILVMYMDLIRYTGA